MQIFKLELWEGEIPHIHHLNQNEIEIIKEKLYFAFYGDTTYMCSTFYQNISTHEKVIGNTTSIDIQQLASLCKLNIKEDEVVYLDWDNFENLIAVSFSDFVKNINNFWYPGSDDLSIFNDDATWVLTIYHHGDITYATV